MSGDSAADHADGIKLSPRKAVDVYRNKAELAARWISTGVLSDWTVRERTILAGKTTDCDLLGLLRFEARLNGGYLMVATATAIAASPVNVILTCSYGFSAGYCVLNRQINAMQNIQLCHADWYIADSVPSGYTQFTPVVIDPSTL